MLFECLLDLDRWNLQQYNEEEVLSELNESIASDIDLLEELWIVILNVVLCILEQSIVVIWTIGLKKVSISHDKLTIFGLVRGKDFKHLLRW